jgi:hypothetical protein
MHGLTRTVLSLSLLLACSPGEKNTDATTETTENTTGTTGSVSVGDTSASTPTTGDPPVTSETSLDTTAASLDTTDPGTTTGEPVECPPDDGLPPEGSPCPMEGQTCGGPTDPCTGFVEAFCQGGVWMHVESEPGPDCEESCEPFPNEGEPCKVEGASCSTGCENQCEFCNIRFCEAGTWQNAEVFPAPCLDCDPLCDFTLQPMCALGPPDKDACVSGCMDTMAGRCEIAFADARACAGDMPTFVCDDAGHPVVDECGDQFNALYRCLGI